LTSTEINIKSRVTISCDGNVIRLCTLIEGKIATPREILRMMVSTDEFKDSTNRSKTLLNTIGYLARKIWPSTDIGLE